MGLFSFLFGKPKSSNLDKVDYVYLNREATNIQLASYIYSIVSNQKVFVVYFFKETKTELEELLDLALPIVLVNGNLEGEVRKLNLSNTELVFAEPCTFFDDEQRLLDILLEKGYSTGPVKIFSSLDDPLFVPFNVERIKKMMVSLGIDPNEAITAPMVTKAMGNAQKKLMKKKPLMSKIDSREAMVRHFASGK